MSEDNNPKDIMRMALHGKRHATALVSIEDPLDYEVRDIDEIRLLYQKYPFIPFFEGADATLRFYQRMRKLSPTHSSIIQSLITYVTGGKLTVVKKQQSGFADFDNETAEVTENEWIEYVEFLDSIIDTGDLLASMRKCYDGYKTWGNAFVEVVLTTVGGQKFAKIYVHDADRCRYMLPYDLNDTEEPKMIGIAAEWTTYYLDKNPPVVIPVYPNMGEYEDGTTRTVIHLKNDTVGREWYGEPDSIGGLFFQFLEYQLGNYTTEGYLNRWIAKVMFETFGDDEDNQDNQDFDNALIDTFTQRGKNRKSVIHRNVPQDGKETKVHEFKPQTDEGFHKAMADIAETQILKAHNWNHLLLGVKIAGSLGNGNEFSQVYRRKYTSKIKPEQEILLEPFREALKIIEEFVGYANPNKLTIGLRDLYWQMIMDGAKAKDDSQETGKGSNEPSGDGNGDENPEDNPEDQQ